jgi:hypothetical protein
MTGPSLLVAWGRTRQAYGGSAVHDEDWRNQEGMTGPSLLVAWGRTWQAYGGIGSASSEGGSVRGSPCGNPARLRFTSLRPASCGCCALYRGPGARRGVPRSGGTFLKYSAKDKGVSPHQVAALASGTGSERAEVASVAERNPPRARVPGLVAAVTWRGRWR